jgi:hypothetical protein
LWLCLVLLVLYPLANSLWAQLPSVIPREVLFGNPEKAGVEISPDGKLLAYRAPHEGVLNVWVRTVGQNDDHVVTADKKRGIRWFIFQYDSEHVLYIQDLDGDENWHVLIIPKSGYQLQFSQVSKMGP